MKREPDPKRYLPQKTDPAAIYAIAAGMPDNSFVVKIGMTGCPHERYADLITGIPFPSAMKWSWVGMRSVAHIVEAKIHQLFADRNTAREWFHFQHGEKRLLLDGISAAFFACTDQLPDWQTITEEQITAFMQSKGKTKPQRQPRQRREFDFTRRAALHERIW